MKKEMEKMCHSSAGGGWKCHCSENVCKTNPDWNKAKFGAWNSKPSQSEAPPKGMPHTEHNPRYSPQLCFHYPRITRSVIAVQAVAIIILSILYFK